MWIERESRSGRRGEDIYPLVGMPWQAARAGMLWVQERSGAWIGGDSTLNGMEKAIRAGLVAPVCARRWLGEMAGVLRRRAGYKGLFSGLFQVLLDRVGRKQASRLVLKARRLQ